MNFSANKKITLKTATAFLFLAAGFLIFAFPYYAQAGMLRSMTDLISDSKPGVSANHTITFKTPTLIPVSGKIRISFEPGKFTMPVGFSFNDVDFAISSTTDDFFVEQEVSSIQTDIFNSVSVTTGSSSVVEIQLSTTTSIEAGKFIRLKMGTHSSYQSPGNFRLANDLTAGSYRIRMATFDENGLKIDDGATMIAVVNPVAVSAVFLDPTPPVRSNGLPTGDIPRGTTQLEVSLNTDEIATCKYSNTAGVDFDSMSSVFSVTRSTFHSSLVTGLIDGNSYSFYVRCKDVHENKNIDDYEIRFNISIVIGPQNPGSIPGGGGGSGPGAAFPPGLAEPQIAINGTSYPVSEVTIIKDGREEVKTSADTAGSFNANFPKLSQGTHSFAVRAKDSKGRISSTKTVTATVVSGTKSIFLQVIVPPTISVNSDTLKKNEPLVVSGEGVKRSVVEVWLYPQSKKFITDRDIIKQEKESGDSGAWEVTYDVSKLPVDTYIVKSRTKFSETEISDFSKPISIGVGRSPQKNSGLKADINKDGKVNLVDFSILLFHWGKSTPEADINDSGKVELADFSIMLFYWTG